MIPLAVLVYVFIAVLVTVVGYNLDRERDYNFVMWVVIGVGWPASLIGKWVDEARARRRWDAGPTPLSPASQAREWEARAARVRARSDALSEDFPHLRSAGRSLALLDELAAVRLRLEHGLPAADAPDRTQHTGTVRVSDIRDGFQIVNDSGNVVVTYASSENNSIKLTDEELEDVLAARQDGRLQRIDMRAF